MAVKQHLSSLGYNEEWIGPRDRTYFVSVYNRTPGGALFEYAWSKPELWTIDEPADELGQTYQVPPTFLDQADTILDYLEPLDVGAAVTGRVAESRPHAKETRMTLSSSLVDVKGRPTEILTAGRGQPIVVPARRGDHRGIRLLRAVGGAVPGDRAAGPGYGATELDPPVNGRDEEAAHVRDVLDALGNRADRAGRSFAGGLVGRHRGCPLPGSRQRAGAGGTVGLDVPEHRGANMMALSPAEIESPP